MLSLVGLPVFPASGPGDRQLGAAAALGRQEEAYLAGAARDLDLAGQQGFPILQAGSGGQNDAPFGATVPHAGEQGALPAQKRAVTGPLDRVTVAVLPSLTDQVSRAM